MKVLYWNCTYPVSGDSFAEEKRQLIKKVLQIQKPDIACLDEVSNKICDVTTAQNLANSLSGGTTYTHPDPGGLIVNPGSHLNSVLLVNSAPAKGLVLKSFQVGIPDKTWSSDGTKRDLLCVTWTNSRVLWFFHANASKGGGEKAVKLAVEHVNKNKNIPHTFVGDFNYRLSENEKKLKADNTLPFVREPKSMVVNGSSKCTQWSRTNTASPGAIQIPAGSYEYFVPNDILDFAITSSEVTVETLDPLTDLNTVNKRDMLLWCDHCPIVFTVG